MHMYLPKQVRWIIDELNNAGYEAYAVGGCVRDMLLNRKPMDWDITTNAKPEQMKTVFLKTVDTGIEHGTVTVIKNGVGYELTTYRVDGEYEDNRHPKEVTFTSDIKDDLCRRDFTINAMAYNEIDGFVDCFGGMKDLEAGIIRCVGNPIERFNEDALRILRAFRFASQLEFYIDENTRVAAEKLAENIKNVSVERITVELIKLLSGNRPEYIQEIVKMGVMKRFWPQLDSFDENTLKALSLAKSKKNQRLAVLFMNQSEDTARKVLKALKLDNETIKTVAILTRHAKDEIYKDKTSLRHLLCKYGEAVVFEILDILMLRAKTEENTVDLEAVRHAFLLMDEIKKDGDCISLKELALKGNDLIQLGITQGKDIGDTLEMLMEAVLEDPSKNQRNALINLIKNN